ncbi:MAG: hypothetical protein KJO43_05910 [Phycisphaerae bacterium]|nr:hypothetical protein [Phycisphaerae bacterium]NNF43843.1 hypothetical protein [Phycisphaerales bacterium]
MPPLAFAATVLATAAEAAPMPVTVRLPETPLEPGVSHRLHVDIDVAEGWSATTAGIPGIFIQLDVPSSARLEGKILESRRALARNEFLIAPFERLVEPGPTEIAFTLDRTPDAAERFGVNVVGYLRDPDGRAHFIRHRFELPLAPGAEGVGVDPKKTSWGGERGGLQVGDRADDFSLPRADGTRIALRDYRDRKHVIVTTYRAHW